MLNVTGLAFADAGDSLFKNEKLTYDGHLFFNAANSAIQGEKYLLNQQLSNIKMGSELQVTDWNKMKGLLIYNTLLPQWLLNFILSNFMTNSK